VKSYNLFTRSGGVSKSHTPCARLPGAPAYKYASQEEKHKHKFRLSPSQGVPPRRRDWTHSMASQSCVSDKDGAECQRPGLRAKWRQSLRCPERRVWLDSHAEWARQGTSVDYPLTMQLPTELCFWIRCRSATQMVPRASAV